MARTRKKSRNPKNWKKNITKELTNKGKRHLNQKTKEIIPSKKMKEPCIECELDCINKFPRIERKEIFKFFWKTLTTINEKRTFILSCISMKKGKHRQAISSRGFNRKFHFFKDDQKLRVCKTFFLNTLSISYKMVQTAIQKREKVGRFNVKEDLRGKGKKFSIPDRIKDRARRFIEEIPKVESHYLRAQTSRL